MASLRRDSFTVLLFRVLTSALAFGIGIVTARQLGSEGRGYYSLFTFGANLYLLLFGGISAALAYQISKGLKRKVVVAHGLALAGAFGLIALVAALIMPAFIRGESSSFWIPIGLAAPFALAASFLNGAFLGSQDIYGLSIGGMLPWLVTLGAMGLFFSMAPGSTLGALSAWALGQMLAACWMMDRARKAWGSPLLRAPDRALIRALLLFGMQISLVNFIGFLNYRAGLFWIGYFLDIESVGLYSVAILTAEGLWFFSSAISTATYARIGRASLEEAGTLTAKALRHSLLVIGIAAVCLFVIADFLFPWVYGIQYRDSVIPFKILLPGVAIYGAASILSTFFTNHLGRPFISLSVAGLSLAANLMLSPLLVPRFGMAGGAWATTASYVAAIGLALWVFLRLTGQRALHTLVIQPGDLSEFRTLTHDLLLLVLKARSAFPVAWGEGMKPIVLILGYPYFVRMLGELLPRELVEVRTNVARSSLRAIPDLLMADVVYIIGGSVKDWRRLATSRFSRGKVIMHWVGTDVLLASAASADGKVHRFLKNRVTHWAEVSWTAKELKEVGIEAHVVPLTSTRFPLEVPPLPEMFTILTYLRDSRSQFYGAEEIRRLAADFPQLRILVVGSSGSFMAEKPLNMKFLGWVDDMASVYAQSTLLVRMTHHDGLAFMVLESLAYGRYVIWSYPFEGALHAKDYDALKAHVRGLFRMHQAGQLSLNETGIRKVREEFEPSAVGRRLAQELVKVAVSSPRDLR